MTENVSNLSTTATILGPVFAFLSSVTWALGSSGYAKLSKRFSPFAVNFNRALVAFPLFALVTLAFHRGWSGFEDVSLKNWLWFSLSIFASYGLGDVLFFRSTTSIGVPAALAIASCYPVYTALIASIQGGAALSRGQWLGMLVAIAGVVLVILSRQEKGSVDVQAGVEEKGNRVWVGFLLAGMTSVLWSLNSYALSEVGTQVSIWVSSSIRMGLGLVMSASFGILFPGVIGRKRESLRMPWVDFRAAIPLFVIEAFGGSLFFMYGMAHASLPVASTLSSLAPVISVPVALVLRLERFSWIRTLGVCLVVMGIWRLV
jgi:drug/metabolite transporter (DMT)-like permease